MHRVDILLQGNLLGRIRHGNIRKPTKISLGPFGSAGKCEPVSKQKGVEPLFGSARSRHGIFAGTGQIAHGLVPGIGDINGGQLAGAVQAGQHGGIPAIVFNPISTFFGDHGRGSHHTVKALLGEMTVNTVATWAGFIDKMQPGCGGEHFTTEFVQRVRIVGNLESRVTRGRIVQRLDQDQGEIVAGQGAAQQGLPVVALHDQQSLLAGRAIGREAAPRNTLALVAGGLPVVEITLRTPTGLEAIRRASVDVPAALASLPSSQAAFVQVRNAGAVPLVIDDATAGNSPFTIEAGAPSHSLYVDDGGRLGFGTSTPVVELHVKDGDTPTLRLEQDGSSGFTPQTWDLAGNETNFFIRDVTNGSALPFRIRPGASSSASASGGMALR